MKLPNADRAIVEEQKLVDYLLDVEHQQGGSKARLLHSLGYSPKNWEKLQAELLQIAVTFEVVNVEDSPWGTRYELVAPIRSSSGRGVMFRIIWQIDVGTEVPRLITMYPG